MTADTVSAIIEDIYAALANDNEDLDRHIARLKSALATAGEKQASFDPGRLPSGNRAGRKLMQAYFRQRGVAVVFA